MSVNLSCAVLASLLEFEFVKLFQQRNFKPPGASHMYARIKEGREARGFSRQRGSVPPREGVIKPSSLQGASYLIGSQFLCIFPNF